MVNQLCSCPRVCPVAQQSHCCTGSLARPRTKFRDAKRARVHRSLAPVHIPGREAAGSSGAGRACQTAVVGRTAGQMNTETISRSDVLWLGIGAASAGALVGGLMLGIGMAMVIERQFAGMLLIAPGVPAAGGIGWLMARRLARRLT